MNTQTFLEELGFASDMFENDTLCVQCGEPESDPEGVCQGCSRCSLCDCPCGTFDEEQDEEIRLSC